MKNSKLFYFWKFPKNFLIGSSKCFPGKIPEWFEFSNDSCGRIRNGSSFFLVFRWLESSQNGTQIFQQKKEKNYLNGQEDIDNILVVVKWYQIAKFFLVTFNDSFKKKKEKNFSFSVLISMIIDLVIWFVSLFFFLGYF